MRTIVVVADPFAGLVRGHDSTLALVDEARRRGHEVLATTVERLSVRDGHTVAAAAPVADPATPVRTIGLADADVVLMRTDPPFDADYLRATYLLDRCAMLVANAPHGLREANEKLFVLRFPGLAPDTVVSADPAELATAVREWARAVLKPTDAMAGRGVLLLRPDDANLPAILQTATADGRRHVLVQRFVAGADRRLIVVDGEPAGAIRRIPAAGDFRANLATGASAAPDTVTDRDQEICAVLAPELRRLGILLAGVDVIDGRVIEVNVTSPTGLCEIEALTPARPISAVLDRIEHRWHIPAGCPLLTART